MYLQGIAIFCLAFVSTSFCYDNTHDDRVFDEIQEAILTGADIDRKYEIVPIELDGRLHKRSSPHPSGLRMKIRALGEDIDMWLHPTDSILFDENTAVFYAEYAPGRPENVAFRTDTSAMRRVGRLLENVAELASVVIGTGKYEGRKVDGHLRRRGIVVRSLSQRVLDEYVRKRRSIDGQDDPSNLNYHLVYKVDKAVDAIEESVLRKRDIRGNSSDIPDTLYLRILVVVEYNMYNSLKNKYININGILKYQMAFWNGVDLKYRSLKNPNIRLNIGALIFESEPQALNYIKKSDPDDGNSCNISYTLDSAKPFFFHIHDSFSMATYDVAVTLTTRIFDSGSYLGLAYLLSVCKFRSNPGETRAIALANDNTAFSGVDTAAHELGHSLGVNHDGERNDCSSSDGYLMTGGISNTDKSSSFSRCSLERFNSLLDILKITSGISNTDKSSLFSRCSLERFNSLLEQGYYKCLYTPPRRYGKELPKLLPGRIASLDEQCTSRGQGVACTPKGYRPNFDICVNYWCLRENGECWETYVGALDGTRCEIKNEAEPGFCLRNKCVRLTTSSRNSPST